MEPFSPATLPPAAAPDLTTDDRRLRTARLVEAAPLAAVLDALELLEDLHAALAAPGDLTGVWECAVCAEPLEGPHADGCVIGRLEPALVALGAAPATKGGA
jgi:hypothetical protein